MGNLHVHPAPGLGDLLPGWYAVPQNPITRAATGVKYTPSIGDILPVTFVVPQNPIKDYTAGQVKMIGQNGSSKPTGGNVGVGCACGGTCGGCGGQGGGGGGMGDISTDLSAMMTDITTGNFAQFGTDFLTLIQEPTVLGIPLWAAGIGVYLAFNALTSHEVTVGRRRHA